MNSRCKSCMFRASDGGGSGGGNCAYIQITGKSRLKQAYKRLNVDRLTDEVREALRPENCLCFREGGRAEIEDGRRITLEGSTPNAQRNGGGPPRASAPTGDEESGAQKSKKEPSPKEEPNPRRKLDPEKALELYREGKSDRAIAEALGLSQTTVCTWRRQAGLPFHSTTSERTERIVALWAKGLSDGEIANELHTNKTKVQRARRRRGLQYNPCKQEQASSVALRERMALYDQGLNDREIAEASGTKLSTVIQWREKRGLPPNFGQKRGREIKWEADGLRLLREGKTDKEIALAVGRSVPTVGAWRNKRGLARNPARPDRRNDGDM